VQVQIASDSEVVSEAMQARNKAEQALACMRATGMLSEEQEHEAAQISLAKIPNGQARDEVQQRGPSHYQDLQQSAEALKAMRAHRLRVVSAFLRLKNKNQATCPDGGKTSMRS